MEQTWRWWGPNDLISLADICQIGASGIVTALHDIPTGVAWSVEAIAERKRIIEADHSLGLRWAVVESVPVHESIKLAEDGAAAFYQAYRETLRNLGAAGVNTVCYNFMPVLDWARTQLRHPLPGGATALRFNAHEFAAFDVHMLGREAAEADWAPDVLDRARQWFTTATEEMKRTLLATIMAGLPRAFDRYGVAELRTMLARYRGLDHARLRANLQRFLKEVVPTAEQAGVRLCPTQNGTVESFNGRMRDELGTRRCLRAWLMPARWLPHGRTITTPSGHTPRSAMQPRPKWGWA